MVQKCYEYKNVRDFPCGCLESLSSAWECWFGCMCEMVGALPPLVNHLIPPCGERSFARRSEAKRDKETVRDGCWRADIGTRTGLCSLWLTQSSVPRQCSICLGTGALRYSWSYKAHEDTFLSLSPPFSLLLKAQGVDWWLTIALSLLPPIHTSAVYCPHLLSHLPCCNDVLQK